MAKSTSSKRKNQNKVKTTAFRGRFFLLRTHFSPFIKVFARLFQKAVASTDSGGRAPQSAKSYFGVFFLIAFSFAAAMAKEKADISLLQWGIDRFAEQTRSASPRQGQKVSAAG